MTIQKSASDTSGDLATGPIENGSRPALIIVDMSNGFTSPDSPLGGAFSEVVNVNNCLVEYFARRNWPVFCSSVVYHNAEQASVFRSRLPDLNILTPESHWVKIDERLLFPQGFQLVEKQLPSAFFQSNLLGALGESEVDSCVVTGLTTSGCVRATAVDALQNNYPTTVISNACGDRNLAAHHASLHDIHAKYGLVMESEQWIHKMESLANAE